MSRFGDDADWSEYANLNYGRFEHNARQVLKSKRGQRALRELKEALLAMPFKALIDDRLIDRPLVYDEALGEVVLAPYFEVCAIGQLAIHKGREPERLWEQFSWDGEYDAMSMDTLDLGESLGLRRTLAYVIADENDMRGLTPVERWKSVMHFIDYHLVPA